MLCCCCVVLSCCGCGFGLRRTGHALSNLLRPQGALRALFLLSSSSAVLQLNGFSDGLSEYERLSCRIVRWNKQFVDVSIHQFQERVQQHRVEQTVARSACRVVRSDRGKCSSRFLKSAFQSASLHESSIFCSRTDRQRLHSPDSGGNFPKPEVLGKVVVSCVAKLVLTSCGMHSTWHRF